jgi:copper(I)-binding protein
MPKQLLAVLLLLVLVGCERSAADPPDPAESVRPSGAAVEVTGAWCRATRPGAPTAACYATLIAAQPDRLTSASSPAAEQVGIHAMNMSNGVMSMREVDGGLDLPAGSPVVLKPGGLHLMLVSLKTPLQAGDEVPITLNFGSAKPRAIQAPVLTAAPAQVAPAR